MEISFLVNDVFTRVAYAAVSITDASSLALRGHLDSVAVVVKA
jgi:hypothetical protein